MSSVLSVLKPFRLNGPLDKGFALVAKRTALRRNEEIERALRDHKVPGVYLWLLKSKTAYYSIYVGQTVSLSGRLRTYLGNFQAHSPNDFKLQVFFAYANEILPSATFELYFFKTDRSNLHSEERKAIDKFGPLPNKLP